MYAGNQIGLIKKVVHALSFTRLVPERSGTEPERFISSLLWNSISKLLRNFWFSYNQLWLLRCWWQWYFGGLLILTVFRCWWQNQTYGDFYCNVVTQCDEKVINILYSSFITHMAVLMLVKDVGEKCMLVKNLYVGEKPSPTFTS